MSNCIFLDLFFKKRTYKFMIFFQDINSLFLFYPFGGFWLFQQEKHFYLETQPNTPLYEQLIFFCLSQKRVGMGDVSGNKIFNSLFLFENKQVIWISQTVMWTYIVAVRKQSMMLINRHGLLGTQSTKTHLQSSSETAHYKFSWISVRIMCLCM